jgi:hypothetical protein
VSTLPVPFEVVHRNERSAPVEQATHGREACVIAECGDGSLVFLLGNEDLAQAADVAGLAQAVASAIAEASLQWPTA